MSRQLDRLRRDAARTARELKQRVRRRGTGQDQPPAGLVSVVVVMRDVEGYVADCLHSLLRQTYSNVQVVVVDDGSVDGSVAKVSRLAAKDPRVIVTPSPRRGVAAARSEGLRLATGDFVTFADADDEVPADAYQRLVSALEASGSDLAVGGLVIGSGQTWAMPEWSRRSNPTRVLATTLSVHPELVANWPLGTKLFRRDFLRETVGGDFGEEPFADIRSAVMLLSAARSVDVLPAAVYRSRVREDGSSLRDRTLTEVGLCLDFINGLRAAERQLAESGPDEAHDRFLREAVFPPLVELVQASMSQGDAYWNSLSKELREILDHTGADVLAGVPVESRLLSWLCAHDYRSATEDFFDSTVDNPNGFDFSVEPDGRYLSVPVLQSAIPDLDRRLLKLAPIDMPLRTRLMGVSWTGQGIVRITGAAFVHYHSSGTGEAVDLVARERGSGQEVSFATVPAPEVDVDGWAGRGREDHKLASFRADVDPSNLIGAAETGKRTVWDLVIRLRTEQSIHEDRFQTRHGASSASLLMPGVVGTTTVVPRWGGHDGLSLDVLPRALALVNAALPKEDAVRFVITGAGVHPAQLVLSSAEGGLECSPLENAGQNRWSGSLTPAQLDVSPPQATLIERRGSRERPVMSATTDLPILLHASSAVMDRDPQNNHVRLTRGQLTAAVEELTRHDEGLLLTGHTSASGDLTFALVGPRSRSTWAPAAVDNGHFRVVLELRRDEWGYGTEALPSDAYKLRCRTAGGEEVSVGAASALHAGFPLQLEVGALSLVAGADQSGALSVTVAAAASVATGGARRQRLTRQQFYEPGLRQPLLPAVFFEAFAGQSGGDNPRPICEELVRRGTGLDIVWSVLDHSISVPPGARKLVRWSEEWFELLARSQYLVTNAILPQYFRKRPGQVYLQTWHGTPLKRIAHDRPHPDFDNWRYLRRLNLETSEWDHLLSQGDFCTQMLRSAFRYEGSVLETGYPRNDILSSDAAEDVRRRVRSHFGIDSSTRLILYAPTWRENARQGRAYRKMLYLDTDQVLDRLPDALIMVRGHYNSIRTADEANGARVIDVTRYPDISDLYLAADALVTDYSSVMFDFALTDKPMVFLCPDLEYYRDYMRGFYFDFQATAPGRIVENSKAVVEALTETDIFADLRAAFRKKFVPNDDGHASARVVEAVLSP